MVVDGFMASGTEEHEVVGLMDVGRTHFAPSPRAVLLEGDDVRNFGKIARREGDVMFEQILVASVEFAASACRDEKEKADKLRHASGLHYRRHCNLRSFGFQI
jgi:hypothetical protein